MSRFDKSLWDEYAKGVIPLKKEKKILIPSNKNKSFQTHEKIHCPFMSYKKFITVQPSIPMHEKNNKKKNDYFSFQASLDLHGLCEDEAYKALIVFLQKMQYVHIKRILIITGKSGILFHNVPKWLNALQNTVKGYVYAKPYHGGNGALYVTLATL